MAERKIITLQESIRLELAGLWRRLRLAEAALAEFDCEHGGGESVAPELRASLERQGFALEAEFDDAKRLHEKANEEHLKLPARR